jgi:hypothetical protein
VAVVILNTKLTASFQASLPVLIQGNQLTLDWDIVASGGPTQIQWYMEFAAAPGGPWRRETAEEDGGSGVVLMPIVVRTFADNNGTELSNGTFGLSTQFVRQEGLARIQARVAAGVAAVTVTASGLPAQLP